MEPPDKITVRWAATERFAGALFVLGDLSLNIRWKRSDDPDEDLRRLRIMVHNLPAMLEQGTREIYIQDQARVLNNEIEEFLGGETDGSA